MRNSFWITASFILLACLMNVYVYAQSPNQIEIRDFPFLRDALTVPYGTEVIWINDDSIGHTVTADDGSFHSGSLAPGERFSHVFDRPGNYRYHCELHPSEQGMIQVTEKSYSEMFPPSKQDLKKAVLEEDEIYSKTQSTDSRISKQGQKVSESSTVAHITPPEKCEICDLDSSPLTSLHTQKQDGGYGASEYQTYPAQSRDNALWIKGAGNWTQYAAVPLGSQLSLIAITSKEGEGYLFEKYPDGQTTKDVFYFYPYSDIGFNADAAGRHVLSFLANDQASNSVVVDVIDSSAQFYQQQSYSQQIYQQQNNPQQSYPEQIYQQQIYQQQIYQQPNYQQQAYQQQAYPQQGYVQQSYPQSNYNLPVSQPQAVAYATTPSPEYSTFWETSAVKMNGSGRLVLDGIQGTDYDLQPSNANVLTRGMLYNGVAYILVANPYGMPATTAVNPQMANWGLQNTEVMYGELTLAQADNMLQIAVPAYQSGLIIIQPQKKRYSFTVGPKPQSSFKAGSKEVYGTSGTARQRYSFSAGPKPAYSFRIGY